MFHRLTVLTASLVAAVTASATDMAPEAWQFFDKAEVLDVASAWSFEDGIWKCDGEPRGYLATRGDFENFNLSFEWRWPEGSEPGNSGVLIYAIPSQPGLHQWPQCVEPQLKHSNAGDIWVLGQGITFMDEGPTFKARGVPAIRSVRREGVTENPLGEWNRMVIHARDGVVEVSVNGVFANRITAVKPTSGRIGFQSEGSPIEFRNVEITPHIEPQDEDDTAE